MDLIEILNNRLRINEKVITVTITKDHGSSPRKVGSMMIVGKDGLIAGSIGGGAIEFKAIEDAKQANISFSKRYELADLDMTCGGDLELFYHVYPKRDKVFIIGAGHICQALSPLLSSLDYNVTVLDHREQIFDDFEYSCDTVNLPIEEGLDTLTFTEDVFVVIVTHGHVYDEVTLDYVLKKPHQYVGMIGSQAKIKNCFNNLINSGVTTEDLEKVYAPIGLNLGGETPAAIALSIASQIQCINNKKEPVHYKSLKDIL